MTRAVSSKCTIYIQRALDELGDEPAGDELTALTPTVFKDVNPLATNPKS